MLIVDLLAPFHAFCIRHQVILPFAGHRTVCRSHAAAVRVCHVGCDLRSSGRHISDTSLVAVAEDFRHISPFTHYHELHAEAGWLVT